MIILAHRGWWTESSDKNSIDALLRAMVAGFGIETDVRDASGEIVISHDPPVRAALRLDEFLEAYTSVGGESCLALNVKADGLHLPLQSMLSRYGVSNYFMFDMSIPELIRYRACGLRHFARLSDAEPQPHGLGGAAGLWVDGFGADWTDFGRLLGFLEGGLQLAIVSAELHGRPHLAHWAQIRSWLLSLPHEASGRVALCTDRPGEAKAFFDE